MKRSKLFIGAATVALAVGSFFVTKANSKKSTFTTCQTIGGSITVTGNFTTTANTKQAYFQTGSTQRKTLYTIVNHTVKAYKL